MSDYTPTTEEVSRRYMFGCWQEHEDTSGDYRAEFDRWLSEVKAHERERMIQILERLGNHGVSHSERCLPRHWIVERAIEEITGETSES